MRPTSWAVPLLALIALMAAVMVLRDYTQKQKAARPACLSRQEMHERIAQLKPRPPNLTSPPQQPMPAPRRPAPAPPPFVETRLDSPAASPAREPYTPNSRPSPQAVADLAAPRPRRQAPQLPAGIQLG